MRILIAYYSNGGSTKKVGFAIKDELERCGHEVTLEKIVPMPEHTVWYWFWYRMCYSRHPIVAPKIGDVSDYDLVCIGSPNWTRIASPVAAYIHDLKGLAFKRVATFATTAGDPDLEWYLVSYYLLETTFSYHLDVANAIQIASVAFSTNIPSLRYDSERGRKKIIDFCAEITKSSPTTIENLVVQQMGNTARLFVILLSVVVAIVLYFVVKSLLSGELNQIGIPQIFVLVILSITLGGSLVLVKHTRHLHFTKIIMQVGILASWTISAVFIFPTEKTLNVVSYVTLLILFSLFRDPKFIISSGVAAIGSYAILNLILDAKLLNIWVDVFLMALCMATISMTTFVARNGILRLISTQSKLAQTQLDLSEKIRETENANKHIVEEKSKTDTILSHLTSGILVVDEKQCMLFANKAAKEILRTSGKEVSEVVFSDFVDIYSKESLSSLVAKLVQKREICLFDEIILQLTVVRISEAEEISYLLILQDVTEERALEKMKIDFASIAAHELRTPITALRGYLSLLTASPTDQVSPENRAFFYSRLQQSSDRLSSLIDSLLAVTRIEKGQAVLSIEEFDFAELIHETIQDQRAAADSKYQTLEYLASESELPKIKTDRMKVKEILTNLITNAIRYTNEKGKITINIVANEDHLILSVIDNGVGISPELQSHLFQKFVRAESSLRKETKGVGLGLYLIKSLTEILHGKVWFESKEGFGSTFYISLPLEITYA